jgi:hypothetical protein
MSQTQEQEKTGLVAVIFNVGSRVTSTSWHSARTWRMRAEEIRALADEMRAPEPKALMLRIAEDYEKLAAWAEKSSVA